MNTFNNLIRKIAFSGLISSVLWIAASCGSDDKLAKDKFEKHDSVATQSTVKDTATGEKQIEMNAKTANKSRKSTEMPESEITTCEKAAEAIFLSSAKIKIFMHHPHAAYTIETRPGDEGNKNRRFGFWAFDNSPELPMTQTFGRFQVDSKTGQLYELDIVADRYHPIPYNRDLNKYIGLCK